MRVMIFSATTGYQLRSFGDAAAKLGIDLAFATDRCRTLDDPWRDEAVAVRFHEEEASLRAVVERAAARPIDGIITVGDRPVRLASLAARALDLDGNPPEAAAASANKEAARERFAAARLPTPWFVRLGAGDASDRRIDYPAVVKPVGLSGSRGVIRVNSDAELEAAVRRVRALLARKEIRALRTGLDDRLLIERYIDGPEFAIEGVLTRGVLHALAIFDKPDPLEGPFFEETIYATPSALPPGGQAAIVDTVGRACAALGLWHGPVHAEVRIAADGIYVLEIAARPIGGLCSRALRFTCPGEPTPASLEEVLLRHAIGENAMRFTREAPAAAVMMIPIPQRGVLRRVEGVEDARAIPGIEDVHITAKRDQLLEPLPEAGSYLGFIFARAESAPTATSALRAAHARLRFAVDEPLPVLNR